MFPFHFNILISSHSYVNFQLQVAQPVTNFTLYTNWVSDVSDSPTESNFNSASLKVKLKVKLKSNRLTLSQSQTQTAYF